MVIVNNLCYYIPSHYVINRNIMSNIKPTIPNFRTSKPETNNKVPKPLFISRKTLAALMGVPYDNLRAWESSGELPTPIKIKGTRLYKRHEIDAFLAQYFTEEELNCG